MPLPSTPTLEIFLATPPGLEAALCAEARAKGFKRPISVPGGVTIRGAWPDAWRANLWLRGASRVLVRIATFKTDRLDDLERRARNVPWSNVLRPDVPVRIEASCSKSRLYHTGAVEERVGNAIRASLGTSILADAPVTVMVRIANDMCTIAVDTSGDLLHKRGAKQDVGRAPMRETLAALLLLQCGYDGREPVLDPMCGSGTFVIEAAEIAMGLNPGRLRSFAFEQLATFDAKAWAAMLATSARPKSEAKFFGSDRDAQTIAMSIANAERAGVASRTTFQTLNISDVSRPDGPPGLVIVNPPYGDRLGDSEKLTRLYRTFGDVMRAHFSGWRVGLVTSDKSLAYACALPFEPPGPPIAHGGLRVTLFQTKALAVT